MRVLHVLGGLNRGGAETWLIQVLRHIDRAKYEFDFLVHTDQPCDYDNEARFLGARILRCVPPSDPLLYARKFWRILSDMGPYDCVHSHVHRFSGYVLALARLAGVPLRVAHSHISDEPVGRRFYRLSMNILLRLSASCGLGVSEEAMASLFGDHWKRDSRWHVSHLGIDLHPFMTPADASQVRAEFGISTNSFVVGHVGRFCPQKNHAFLLEIAKRVCAVTSDALFFLVGDGPLRKEMEARARTLGLDQRVRFLGVRDDVVRLMRGLMDVFVLPSLYEGFPMVLLEAQAAGLPCCIADTISRETDILPELISRQSLSDSPEHWAESILAARRLSRVPFVSKALHEFGIDASVRRLCNAYEHC